MTLLDDAIRAKNHAYAPYSKFTVGAALRDEKGKIFAGCNVENSSYGATTCAERNAIATMIAGGGTRFTEILVVTDTLNGCPPCGICRQVLVEFAVDPATAKVHIANATGVLKTFTLRELLPEAFDAGYLKTFAND